MMKQKEPQRQVLGKLAKARGKQFEIRLDASFAWCEREGIAIVEKTPEPMHPIQNLGGGKFIAFFEKKAQPDYKGVLAGGRAVVLEAKFTASDRILQSRVTPGQQEYMNKHAALGALCLIIVGFPSGAAYRIPWSTWRDMKSIFGRKFITESELHIFRVPTTKNGILEILGWRGDTIATR